jgi:Protein of unknown function (DUF3011)
MTLRTLRRSAVVALLSSGLATAAAAQQNIKCESNNGGRNYCGSYAPNQVTMDRQISGSPCVRGSTWGVDNRGLWVDRGCRATFIISRGGYPGGGYPGGGSGGSTVKCESNNGKRNYCGNYQANQVTMNQQISGSPCVRGSTWGVDNGGLWVDRGCRAIFNISGYGNRPGGGGYHGAPPMTTIKCESNNGKRNYCGSYAPNQVTMNQQISGSPCVRNNTWGVDNRGLWVDRGCRATFNIAGGRY